MDEVWKDIEGFESKYRISNKGNVFSVKNNKILAKKYMTSGYVFYALYKRGYHYLSAHRLVATHFIENKNNLPEVNHIDENKLNNNVSNLEWCTRKQNLNHGTCTKRIINSKGYKESVERSKKKVVGYLDGKEVLRLDSMVSGELYGFCKQSISACCRGKLKKHKGYTWKFLEDVANG